jgi:C4-dicarboxylate transporter DctM subunit
MDALTLAAWSFPVLLVLIFLRLPIGLAMLVIGLAGSWQVYGSASPLLNQMKTMAYGTFSTHSLSIVPLFLLMGQFATLGGMSQALFKAAEAFLGHRRGGVGMAAIGACAGFGSICGSSMATAATMGQVALPELKRAGYSGALSSGLLAAGGTLGILIPPSIVLVIYAILAEQNIAKMFAAAFVPGILAALGYMLVINLVVRFSPSSAGQIDPMPWGERMQALVAVWPVLLIFAVVIGGIYSGIFTPTEGAAVGAVATGLLAWQRGGLRGGKLREAFEATAGGSGDGVPDRASARRPTTASWPCRSCRRSSPAGSATQGFGPYQVLWAILIFYVIAGCFMDSLSMILLTIPIFFPMVSGLDFGLTPEEDGDLVRHPGADRRRGGADHATGGHEPVRHPVDGARDPHPRCLPRRDALRCQRPDPGGGAGGGAVDLAVRRQAVSTGCM